MGGVSVDTGGGKKGKKALDATINLVPFIDLLSCCIAFLLITAVWTQISKLQVMSQGGQSDAPPPDDVKTVDIRLMITERGYTLTAGGIVEIPKGTGGYDTKVLQEKLKAIKSSVGDTQRNITVAAEDTVAFEDLVKVVDLCNAEGFPDVTVAPAVG